MRPIHYLRCLIGVSLREWLRFLNQRGRFFSALVRPLVWLAIFATGFQFVLGVSIIPPYDTYIPYPIYIAPGLIAMILMFNGMFTPRPTSGSHRLPGMSRCGSGRQIAAGGRFAGRCGAVRTSIHTAAPLFHSAAAAGVSSAVPPATPAGVGAR